MIRHAERADSAWDSEQGWFRSQDFWQYPLDPPITEAGVAEAGEVGQQLCEQLSQSGSKRFTVVSSPYLRCVQTAIKICQAQGKDSVLLLDNELGEVYGPDIFGEEPERMHTRPMEVLIRYCKAQGVNVHKRKLGRSPVWPETIHGARFRFLSRFLRYLHRSRTCNRNFVLVTHADAVAAALSAMPSMNGYMVQKVGYCGRFLAASKLNMRKVRQRLTQAQENTPERVPSDGSVEVPDLAKVDFLNDEDARAPSSWKVVHSNVKVVRSGREGVETRVRRWVGKTDFTEQQMLRLLRFTPATPLENKSENFVVGSASKLSDGDIADASPHLSTAAFASPQICLNAWSNSPRHAAIEERVSYDAFETPMCLGDNLSRRPHAERDLGNISKHRARAALSIILDMMEENSLEAPRSARSTRVADSNSPAKGRRTLEAKPNSSVQVDSLDISSSKLLSRRRMASRSVSTEDLTKSASDSIEAAFVAEEFSDMTKRGRCSCRPPDAYGGIPANACGGILATLANEACTPDGDRDGKVTLYYL